MLRPTQLGDLLTAAAHEALRFDAHGRSAERRIDDFGQVVAIRNPGQGWQHARYDEAGRLVEIRDPRGATTLARYDAAGRLLRIERALPGDSSERLDLVWRGPERLSETVTIAGRQTHATHYRRNPWGQVSRMQVEIAGIDGGAPVRMSLQSRHDAAGRLIARTLPGGERLAWRYYASAPYRGQQAAIERIHWPVWLDGLMTRLPEAWLDSWRWKTRIATLAPGDNEAALQSSSAPGMAALSAMPDAAPRAEPGLSAEAPGSDHDAAGLPHRLRTSKGELALRWNAAGQLVEVRAADAEGGSPPLARYRYDARGRRASKHTAGGGEYYLYEGTQLVAAVKMDRHGRHSLGQYLYEGYRAIAWLHDGVAYALQTDHRGALTEVQSLQDDGKPVKTLWRAQLDAWGKRPSSAAASPHDPGLRLLNQYADDETGLSYHIARYYHPGQGRFISPDPAGIADTLSADVPPALQLDLTAYVAGQPWHYVDPDGAARLIYYAITTNAKGKPLGTTQGFTRARWAFSIDGIEASGDGGSDAINRLMEKYAKNQTGLLFDGGGNYLTGGKKAVSWNGAADETVDGFRRHYGGNLIGLANFTIENFSNRDAALLVAGLAGNSEDATLCPAKNMLLPTIKFSSEENPIFPAQNKIPQRILNCGDILLTSNEIEALQIKKLVKLNQAISLNEISEVYKNCTLYGCPSAAGIFLGAPSEYKNRLPAAFSHLQFAPETFTEIIMENILNDSAVSNYKISKKIIDRMLAEGVSKDDLALASMRARWVYVYADCLSGKKNRYLYKKMGCPLGLDSSKQWGDLKESVREEFSMKTGLKEEAWNFLKKFANNELKSKADYVSGTNPKELLDSLSWYAWSTVSNAEIWFKKLAGDNSAGGKMEAFAIAYFQVREQQLINDQEHGLKYSEEYLYPLAKEKNALKQRDVDLEMAMRLARRHNGGAWWRSIENLKKNDENDYVKKISGSLGFDEYGNYPSLRCVRKADIDVNGLLFLPINLG